MSFSGKVILITGASSGIGAHSAVNLAKKGGTLALVGRNEQRLQIVSEEIRKSGAPTPLVIVADVAADSERIINETISHLGKLDVLINCAGVVLRDSIEDFDLDEFDRIMNVNVRSVIKLTKLAVPHLAKTKGNILNVSSSAGLRVKPNMMTYCISKAAVDHFTKSTALDLAPKGIRVNAINPVAISTPMLRQTFGMSSEEAKEHFKDIYPLGRIGEVTDTSAVIEFLVSDSAAFLTGLLMPVDGGALIAGK